MTEQLRQELGEHIFTYKRELIDVSTNDYSRVRFDRADYTAKRDIILERMVKFGLIKSKKAGYEEEYQYVADGGAVSYSRMARGLEKCFIRKKKSYTKSWYRLYVNMSIPYSVSNETITEASMKVFSLIEALRRIGIEIEVYSVLRSNNPSTGSLRSIAYVHPVKTISDAGRYSPDFYINQLSGAFFRERGFEAIRKSCRTLGEEPSPSLGSPVKLKGAVNIWEFDMEELLGKIADDLQLRVIKNLLKDGE